MANSATLRRGVFFATAGALLWGFSGCCAQYLFANYDIAASFVTMVRSLVAGLMFLAVLIVGDRATLQAVFRDRSSLGRLVVFGIGLFGSQFAFVMSVGFTNAGTATVLQMSGTAFIMVFTCMMGRCLPHVREVAGLACAVAATWLIATQGDADVLALPPEGVVWGVINGLAVALYIMYPKKLFASYGSFASTGLAMFVCSAVAALAWAAPYLASSFGFDGMGVSSAGAAQLPVFPALDAVGWLALTGGVGCVGTFVAFGMYLHGVSIVGSVTGGLLGAFEPLGAMVVSALWLGTAFTGADWAGFALMLIMLVLVTVPNSDRRPAAS